MGSSHRKSAVGTGGRCCSWARSCALLRVGGGGAGPPCTLSLAFIGLLDPKGSGLEGTQESSVLGFAVLPWKLQGLWLVAAVGSRQGRWITWPLSWAPPSCWLGVSSQVYLPGESDHLPAGRFCFRQAPAKGAREQLCASRVC